MITGQDSTRRAACGNVGSQTMDNPSPGYFTHITVNRIAGVGPWSPQR